MTLQSFNFDFTFMFRKIKFQSLLGNAWVLLLMAVLIAGALALFLYRYLGEREARLKAEMTVRPGRDAIAVVVPRRDVPAGTPLADDEFVSREIPADLVYDDMVRVADFASYRKATLARGLLHGRPLRMADIDALRGRDFSDTLPAGQRALTLEIDTINSTASMVRPGNRVDVYWVGTHMDSSTGNGKAVRLLMADVLVLATGQNVQPRDAGDTQENTGDGRYSTVTVQVPASDAARVVLAQKLGALRLILKHAGDKGGDGPTVLTEIDLFPSDHAAATAPTSALVEVIAGGGSTGMSGSTSIAVAMPATASTPPHLPPPTPLDSATAVAHQLQQRDARRASDHN